MNAFSLHFQLSRKHSINNAFLMFVYLGDSERSRAPCTNNAQVKFTTRKNILRHRKNKRRGTLGSETGSQIQAASKRKAKNVT